MLLKNTVTAAHRAAGTAGRVRLRPVSPGQVGRTVTYAESGADRRHRDRQELRAGPAAPAGRGVPGRGRARARRDDGRHGGDDAPLPGGLARESWPRTARWTARNWDRWSSPIRRLAANSKRWSTRPSTARSPPALRAFELLGDVPIAVVDVPLLYETGHEKDFARVIATVCPPEMQIARLVDRGLTPEAARQRLAAQWPAEQEGRTRGLRDQDRRHVRADRSAGGPRADAPQILRSLESLDPRIRRFSVVQPTSLMPSTSVASCAGAMRSSTNVFQS